MCNQPTRRKHECVRSLLEGGVDTRHECRHPPTGVTERTSLSSAWVECTSGTSYPPPELNRTRIAATVTSVVSAVTQVCVYEGARHVSKQDLSLSTVDDVGTRSGEQWSRVGGRTRRRRDDGRSSTTQRRGERRRFGEWCYKTATLYHHSPSATDPLRNQSRLESGDTNLRICSTTLQMRLVP